MADQFYVVFFCFMTNGHGSIAIPYTYSLTSIFSWMKIHLAEMLVWTTGRKLVTWPIPNCWNPLWWSCWSLGKPGLEGFQESQVDDWDERERDPRWGRHLPVYQWIGFHGKIEKKKHIENGKRPMVSGLDFPFNQSMYWYHLVPKNSHVYDLVNHRIWPYLMILQTNSHCSQPSDNL